MNTNWRTYGEIAAAVAVVLSLLFVGYEIRLSRDIAAVEGLGTAGQFQTAVYDALTQHSDVWYRGCLGEELTPSEQVTFANLYAQVESRAFITVRRAEIGITGANRAQFVQAFALSVYRFPGFKRVFEDYSLARTTDYDLDSAGDFVQLIRRTVDELERTGASKEGDPAFCGRV